MSSHNNINYDVLSADGANTVSEDYVLSESDQLLLSKYFDKECSFFERIKVSRLLKRSKSASQFLDSLRSVSTYVKEDSIAIKDSYKPELWFRISARISSEEKSALMLGSRIIDNPAPSVIYTFKDRYWPKEIISKIWGDRIFGGLVGACTVLVIFILPGIFSNLSPSSKYINYNLSNTNSNSIHYKNLPNSYDAQHPSSDISLSSSYLSSSNLSSAPSLQDRSLSLISRQDRSAMDVDWVRSDGRVQVLQGSDERAPIIWIKRRGGHSQSIVAERNSQGIIMMNNNSVPNGIAVASK